MAEHVDGPAVVLACRSDELGEARRAPADRRGRRDVDDEGLARGQRRRERRRRDLALGEVELCLDLGLVQYVQANVDGRYGEWQAIVDAGASGEGTFSLFSMAASPISVTSLSPHGLTTGANGRIVTDMGGALGTVVDRLLHGHVVDFIQVHWAGWYFPSFNLADSAITLGAVLLIIDEIRRVRRA